MNTGHEPEHRLGAELTGSCSPIAERSGGTQKAEERPHWLSPLVSGWIMIVAICCFAGRQIIEDYFENGLPEIRIFAIIAAVVVGVFVIQCIIGFVEWKYTRFRIDDEELSIIKSFISLYSEKIAVNKVQSVDIVQPFAARLLGLARLKIDVGAGSAKKIQYLKRADAVRFRDFLIRKAQGERISRAESDAVSNAGIFTDQANEDELITRSSPGQLIVSALLQVQVIVAVIIANAGIFGGLLSGHGLAPGLGTVVIAAMAIVGYIQKVVISKWNFSLVSSGGGLKVVHGITTLTSRSIPVNRIQGISIEQEWLWRPFGLYRIQLSFLGQGVMDDEENRTLLAVGNRSQVDQALNALWPGFTLDTIELEPIPARARPFHWFNRKLISCGVDDNAIVSHKAFLKRTIVVVPHARVQSVSLDQGPLRRRLRLATVDIHVGGLALTQKCEDVDENRARQIVDAEMDLCRHARIREMQGHSLSSGAFQSTGAAGSLPTRQAQLRSSLAWGGQNHAEDTSSAIRGSEDSCESDTGMPDCR